MKQRHDKNRLERGNIIIGPELSCAVGDIMQLKWKQGCVDMRQIR